jgi:hypothetical protein
MSQNLSSDTYSPRLPREANKCTIYFKPQDNADLRQIQRKRPRIRKRPRTHKGTRIAPRKDKMENDHKARIDELEAEVRYLRAELEEPWAGSKKLFNERNKLEKKYDNLLQEFRFTIRKKDSELKILREGLNTSDVSRKKPDGCQASEVLRSEEAKLAEHKILQPAMQVREAGLEDCQAVLNDGLNNEGAELKEVSECQDPQAATLTREAEPTTEGAEPEKCQTRRHDHGPMEGIELRNSEDAPQVGLDKQHEGDILCAITAIGTPDALDYDSDDVWGCFDDSAADFFGEEFPVVNFMACDISMFGIKI